MISLDDYIIKNFDNSTEDEAVFDIIKNISSGIIQVSEILLGNNNKNIFGDQGAKNIHGEDVQKLDIIATDIFVKELKKSASIKIIGCEELDELQFTDNNSNLSYTVMMDPLDGSSNIDVSISIGSIFGIWKHIPGDINSILLPGNKIELAIYSIYGPNTVLVFGYKSVVCMFILDHFNSKFVLYKDKIKLPDKPKYYSVNESNYSTWDKNIQEYINNIKSNLSLRYVGSLIADFHRNLLKGGVFLYPEDTIKNKSKLRLMYEANPLAYINKLCGGLSVSNGINTLDIIPENIHQSVPLIIGNASLIEQL